MHLNLGKYQFVWLGLDGFRQFCPDCHHIPTHYRFNFVWPTFVRPEGGLGLVYSWLLFCVFFDIRKFTNPKDHEPSN